MFETKVVEKNQNAHFV